MRISLDASQTIISAAFKAAESRALSPLAVAVLDGGGHLVAFERQDGAANMRFQIAHGKAFGAISLGVGSRSLMERAEKQPYFIASATAAVGGALVPVPGGVLVRDPRSGETIGVVGVSGDTSDNDEVAAIEGIVAAGYEAIPGGSC